MYHLDKTVLCAEVGLEYGKRIVGDQRLTDNPADKRVQTI
jgi:hypothetical protein